ncbi:seryl-tRNA synthetase [Paenibacillus sp. UNCCL117]|uniref:serine--tRNA ligase n=1 Tax=unclassified Paenibacillus TaxID=185978 RepID=UPI000882187A|nr:MULTISPECIES: serine--tRNA ligase [unclassified Paenibacillus]SDD48780.1 seryl-tRNA synthetase [Paenibacillus sp. cl123]SFW50171.1 seryl-tRNA synthetase [Paenibacillus sp. UNCCL117]
MLELDWIHEHEEQIQQVADQKGIRIAIRELLAVDADRRRLLRQVEELRRQRNRDSEAIAAQLRGGHTVEAEKLKHGVKEVNGRLAVLESELDAAQRRLRELMLLVPNPVSPDTPRGYSEADNVECRRFGEPPSFGFEPRDHMALGDLHRIIDVPRGVRTAGSRQYYLQGAGALLHRAVQQLALDMLLARGFTLLEVPLMARTESLVNTGFFPTGEDQTFPIKGEDKWLVGTSEVPLIAYYSGEVVDLSQPLRLAAVSTCFRSEVGSAGKDVHGLYRVHQFAKVEQVILCEADPELSERLLQEITRNAEDLLRLLELPYRVMAVCAGDMSAKSYKQYDIETWMPSRQAYGETHSASALLDYQARRAQIRYRKDGQLRCCHTLNNTAVATPRILIPLLENHQQEDGSIRIPQALRPYMNGLELLIPPGERRQ